MNFECPVCRKILTVKEGRAGRRAKCPGCESSIVIPEQTKAFPPDIERFVQTVVQRGDYGCKEDVVFAAVRAMRKSQQKKLSAKARHAEKSVRNNELGASGTTTDAAGAYPPDIELFLQQAVHSGVYNSTDDVVLAALRAMGGIKQQNPKRAALVDKLVFAAMAVPILAILGFVIFRVTASGTSEVTDAGPQSAAANPPSSIQPAEAAVLFGTWRVDTLGTGDLLKRSVHSPRNRVLAFVNLRLNEIEINDRHFVLRYSGRNDPSEEFEYRHKSVSRDIHTLVLTTRVSGEEEIFKEGAHVLLHVEPDGTLVFDASKARPDPDYVTISHIVMGRYADATGASPQPPEVEPPVVASPKRAIQPPEAAALFGRWRYDPQSMGSVLAKAGHSRGVGVLAAASLSLDEIEINYQHFVIKYGDSDRTVERFEYQHKSVSRNIHTLELTKRVAGKNTIFREGVDLSLHVFPGGDLLLDTSRARPDSRYITISHIAMAKVGG